MVLKMKQKLKDIGHRNRMIMGPFKGSEKKHLGRTIQHSLSIRYQMLRHEAQSRSFEVKKTAEGQSEIRLLCVRSNRSVQKEGDLSPGVFVGCCRIRLATQMFSYHIYIIYIYIQCLRVISTINISAYRIV